VEALCGNRWKQQAAEKARNNYCLCFLVDAFVFWWKLSVSVNREGKKQLVLVFLGRCFCILVETLYLYIGMVDGLSLLSVIQK
jgi:hypothetical protein